MERLTDEQREAVAALVPDAKRIAGAWIGRRKLPRHMRDEVEAAFLVALARVVPSYDPERCGTINGYLAFKLPRAAVDVLRAEWGRADPKHKQDAFNRAVRSLSAPVRTRGRAKCLADYAVSRQPGPEAAARLSDTVEAVRRNLPEQHSRVLLETVVGGRLLREVAEEMGCIESRAAQLRDEAAELLKIGGFMRRAFA